MNSYFKFMKQLPQSVITSHVKNIISSMVVNRNKKWRMSIRKCNTFEFDKRFRMWGGFIHSRFLQGIGEMYSEGRETDVMRCSWIIKWKNKKQVKRGVLKEDKYHFKYLNSKLSFQTSMWHCHFIWIYIFGIIIWWLLRRVASRVQLIIHFSLAYSILSFMPFI